MERVNGSEVRVVLAYPAGAENSLLHVMGTAECGSCCDGVSSALFGVSVVDSGNSTGSSGTVQYWPSHIDIDVEHRMLQAVVSLPSFASSGAVSRVRIDFENAVSYPECALYNEANLPALPFSVEVDVPSGSLLDSIAPSISSQ